MKKAIFPILILTAFILFFVSKVDTYASNEVPYLDSSNEIEFPKSNILSNEIIEFKAQTFIQSNDEESVETYQLEDFFEIEVLGLDGSGFLQLEAITGNFEYDLSFQNHVDHELSNDDVILIVVRINNSIEVFEYVVEGLVSEFDGLFFFFEGSNGNGRVDIIDENDYINYKLSFRNNFDANVSNGKLKNGHYVLIHAYDSKTNKKIDTITVSVIGLED